MLKNFAIALVATTLLAGPALAAQASDNGGSGAAPATTQMAPAVTGQQPAKQAVKHGQVRKHVARHTTRSMHQARHFKAGKTHQARHMRPSKTHQANVNAAAKRS